MRFSHLLSNCCMQKRPPVTLIKIAITGSYCSSGAIAFSNYVSCASGRSEVFPEEPGKRLLGDFSTASARSVRSRDCLWGALQRISAANTGTIVALPRSSPGIGNNVFECTTIHHIGVTSRAGFASTYPMSIQRRRQHSGDQVRSI